MEMEMLDARDSLPEMLDEVGKWEDDPDEADRPAREKPSRATLAWRRTVWACTKVAKVVPGFHWDGKRVRWIDGMFAEKARRWEEEDRLNCEEEERRKMGRGWDQARPSADLFVFVGWWSKQKGVGLITDAMPSL